VFRSHYRGLKWIIIRFIPLFLLLYVFLLILSVFAEFKFTNLNHKIRRYFLKPKRSKKIPNVVQNDPTRTHRSKYHGLGRANDEVTKRNEEKPGQPPPRVVMVVTTTVVATRGGPPHPGRSVFLRDVPIFRCFGLWFLRFKACVFSHKETLQPFSST